MKAFLEKHSPQANASYRFLHRVDDGFAFAWHYHPEIELTLIVQARGRRFVGDCITEFREGDLVLLGPNLPHTWYSPPAHPKRIDSHQAICVQFKMDFLGGDFFARQELVRVSRLLKRSELGLQILGSARAEVAASMKKMIQLEGLPRLLALLGVLERLSRARKAVSISSKGFFPALRHEDAKRMDDCCAFINTHFREPLTQAEVASRAHVSVSAFSRIFKRSMGKSFKRYLNELRVGYACRLLVEGNLSVLEVCYESGYKNLSNFNRRFLDLKGVPPKAYRRAFWDHHK